jgi:hypothetical protein
MPRITTHKRISLVLTAVTAVVLPIFGYATLRSRPDSHLQFAPGLTAALEVELITLRPAACEPIEIVRPKGPFVLFIDDRSGKETSLVLQRWKGEHVRAINLNRRRLEWQDVLDLLPGTYVLHGASIPELSCQITILP